MEGYDFRIIEYCGGYRGQKITYFIAKVYYNSKGVPRMHEEVDNMNFATLDEVLEFCAAKDKPVVLYNELTGILKEK